MTLVKGCSLVPAPPSKNYSLFSCFKVGIHYLNLFNNKLMFLNIIGGTKSLINSLYLNSNFSPLASLNKVPCLWLDSVFGPPVEK